MNPTCDKRETRVHLGQDSWHAASQHALAGTRWPNKQQVVPSCGCDLERLASKGVACDIGQVGKIASRIA